MKPFLPAIIIVLAACCAKAQAQTTVITGVLVDSLSRSAEPFAHVRVFGEADRQHPAAMSVTDIDGRISQTIDAPHGTYIVQISSVGRQPVERTISLHGQPAISLDTIAVADDVKMLQGVQIVAQKQLVKMEADRMTYNVADDADSKTNTLLDMLRKVPMVAVDGNDQITVNGNGNFKVYVNGKPNAMMTAAPSEIFKTMPASAVQNIEVITHPGAKYDAEGTGGILNLITDPRRKNDTQHMANGSANATVSHTSASGGGSINVQSGRLFVSAQANASLMRLDDMAIEMTSLRQGNGYTTLMTGDIGGDTKLRLANGSVSAEYEIDSLNVVSASFGIMGNETHTIGEGRLGFEGDLYPTAAGYELLNDSRNTQTSITGSADYHHTFARNPQQTLTVAYMFTKSPQRNNSETGFGIEPDSPFAGLADRLSRVKNHTWDHTWQTDFALPMAGGQNIDMGMKFIFRQYTATSDYYTDTADGLAHIAGQSTDYSHDSKILAAYAEYRKRFERLTFTAGLRYEHTWQSMSDFGKDYGNWAPSAQLSYSIGTRQNIGATYGLRISRPGINYLNPYVDRSDPTALTYGNPSLTSEEMHNLGLVYNYSSAKWSVSLTLRHSMCDNGISAYSFYADDLLHNTYGNIVRSRQSGANAFVNWNAGSKTRLMFNGGTAYADYRSSQQQLHTHGWQANGMIGLQQTLPQKLRLSVNIMASTKQYNLQGWTTGFNAAMASLSRTFAGDKMYVALSGIVPLTGGKMKIETQADGTGYSSHNDIRVPLQPYHISIGYTFNKNNMAQRKARRKIDNTDVKNPQSQTDRIGNMMMR